MKDLSYYQGYLDAIEIFQDEMNEIIKNNKKLKNLNDHMKYLADHCHANISKIGRELEENHNATL